MQIHLKGKPNELVKTRKRLGNKQRVVKLFKMDEDGYATIETDDYPKHLVDRLLTKFERLVRIPGGWADRVRNAEYADLQEWAKDYGIKANLSKKDLIEELLQIEPEEEEEIASDDESEVD